MPELNEQEYLDDLLKTIQEDDTGTQSTEEEVYSENHEAQGLGEQTQQSEENTIPLEDVKSLNVSQSDESKNNKKENNNKKQKNKSGILKKLKHIFSKNKDVNSKDQHTEKTITKPTTKPTITQEDVQAATIENELQVENASDENSRVIQELYGEASENQVSDDKATPKKGIFAKIKDRFHQNKLKNLEEKKIEQESIELEEQEKKKEKEKKLAASKEKKEQKKKAKQEKTAAAKAKKDAKPKKPPKEKKPKQPPKPGDILKIRPVPVVLFVLFVSGIVLLIYVANAALHYNNAIQTARIYTADGDYEKAYSALDGVELKETDQTMYDQSKVITYLQRQYSSYENYSSINYRSEALNALIKGIQRYDDNYEEADLLGVSTEYDQIKTQIVNALQSDFNITEEQARDLVALSQDDFTQYYYNIEAYGDTK